MAGISMSAVQELAEPAPAWRFLVDLPDLPAIPASERFKGLAAKQALKAVRIESTSVPQFIITDETEYFGGGADFFATTTTIGDLSLTVYESKDYDALDYFYHWQMLVCDTDGNYGLPEKFKLPITVRPLTSEGKIAKTLRLLKCWPTTIAPFEYTSASSERITCVVTLKVGAPDYVQRDGDNK